ncbi:MAG: radical SAM protein [Phenylobacterium sp.]|uniref:B12-binding domain-containing radical SAM protein n=1 Tax=Phenylobacterium sp. TaxID=1871053 RepID=UPI0012055F6F|nr:radical SAM protein [Phenylobacterium sp.]TAJ69799.1 MAG: radical SAM protein [Phenylobacterium sp.]
MTASYLRVALVLPPVQSFNMPYSAPAALASLLQERFGAQTLVVDAGVEWLASALRDADPAIAADLGRLRDPSAYRDAFALREAHAHAEAALQALTARWAPETVQLSGEYVPPDRFENWDEVRRSLERPTERMFDGYVRRELIPKLRSFHPQIVGLSVPFDWMLWPTLRLLRFLRRSCPDVVTIVGGPAIQRLWNEGQAEFFDILDADWAAIGDGERALIDLVGWVCRGEEPQDPALVRLPPEAAPKPRPQPAGFYDRGVVPDYSDLDLAAYLRPEPILPIPASEGCYYGRCRFCSRQRRDQAVTFVETPGRQVAEAMRRLQRQLGVTQFVLTGDILTRRFLLGVANDLSMDNAPLNWFCEASFKASMAGRLTEADCERLYAGGCRLILNGLESGSARIRELMDCQVNEAMFRRTLRRLSDAGVVPYVTIVFGYPGETAEDLMATAEFIRTHQETCVFATSRFEIVPGTPLADQLQQDPRVRCTPRSVLEGGWDHDAEDTLGDAAARAILERDLGGMFGRFPQFYRQIPVLMQLLSKTWPRPVPRRPANRRERVRALAQSPSGAGDRLGGGEQWT